jgi:prolyl 4-hydroxylase
MSTANPVAQFEEGLQLLAGPNTPSAVTRGLALVDSAAAAGHPDAIARRALFECVGLGRQRDWSKALDSLARAAELGSRAAAHQLELLADQPIDDVPAARRATAYGDLRARISTAQLLEAHGAHMLSRDPLVLSLNSIATPGQCRWLIELARPRLERALLATNPPRPDPARTNQSASFRIAHLDLVVEAIRTRIANAISVSTSALEVSQVLHYNPGDQFALHCDFLDPAMKRDQIAAAGQRKTTVIVYLNDDFEGGETSFPDLAIMHRGEVGDALAFMNLDRTGQPDLRTKHAGLPPTSGEKWVFSQWVRNRASAGVRA